MQRRFRSAQTHPLALAFGCMLLVMIAFAFVTFAYGSYIVYNQPISNVVATTIHESNGTTVVELDGSGFQPSSQREVWIDPSFSPMNASLLNPNSCCYLGNVTTDSSGNVPIQNLTLSGNFLARLATDGFAPHYVVIMGTQQPIAPGPYSTPTYDVQANYSAATYFPPSSGIVFFVTLLTIQIPVGYTLGQLFIVLWTVFLLLFAIALNGPFKSIAGALRESYRTGVRGIFSNAMFAVMALFTVTFWGQVLLADLQSAGGISTGSLAATDPLLTFLSYAIAPIREELGFRVIPIGVAALVVLFLKGRVKDGLMALWHPMRYLKKSDSPRQYRTHQILMYVLIAISAALFGYAHVFFGGGWGIGKIAEAGGVGVAFGVLYYRYGLPSTILIHWAFDYMYGAYVFSGALLAVSNYLIIYTIPVAIASTIALCAMLGERIRSRNTAKAGVQVGTV